MRRANTIKHLLDQSNSKLISLFLDICGSSSLRSARIS